MKFLLILAAVYSISGLANDNCSYVSVGHPGRGSHLPILESKKIVEDKLSQKGFREVFEVSRAKYRVDFRTDFNSMSPVRLALGDNVATATLQRIEDQKVLATATLATASGVVGTIAKKSQSRILLKRILKSFPDCSQL